MEEGDLRGAIELTAILELAAEAGALQHLARLVEVILVLGRQVAGGQQAGAFDAGPLAQPHVGLDEHVKALLGRDAREVADGERTLRPRAAAC